MQESFTRTWLLGLVLAGMMASCDQETVEEPAFLHIPSLGLVPEPGAVWGNTSSKVTTAWVEVDGINLGAHHLPATLPILMDQEGPKEIRLYPGININGISSFRGIYPFYTDYVTTTTLKRGVTTTVPLGNNPKVLSYDFSGLGGNLVVAPLENFESVGPTYGGDPSKRHLLDSYLRPFVALPRSVCRDECLQRNGHTRYGIVAF